VSTTHEVHTAGLCRGRVLIGGSEIETDGRIHKYCSWCAAFTFAMDADLPSGTDLLANDRAWQDGKKQSPPRAYG